MNTGHPSEMELQQYASDRSTCGAEMIAHIEACENCKTETTIYQMLYTGIREQPKPAFDFDLSGLVLSQLPARLPEESPVRYPSLAVWLLLLLTAGITGIALYLFRKNIRNMFGGISVFFTYCILTAAVFILLFRMMGMYRKYRHQIEALNF